MVTGLIGKKLQQTRIYTDDGQQIPVTYIEAGPCEVVQAKEAEKDGYVAVQLGFGTAREKRITKPLAGHLKKTGKLENKLPRFLREVSVVESKSDEAVVLKSGDTIKVGDVFSVGDTISVTGTSKGKGFAGVIKRHGFHGGPKTHGQSDRERSPGSIGQSATPGRVYRGKKMAGRMGGKTATIRGLTVVSIDADKNTLAVKGLIPGNTGKVVFVQKQ